MRTVSNSSSFSWCHFRLWTAFPGEKADKMNKWLPPQWCEKSIKRLCDYALSRNRHLAQGKVELNQVEFRPKRGLSFCLYPWCCPSRGKHRGMILKLQKLLVGSPQERKEGWWGIEGPKGRFAPAKQLPGEERCSPPWRKAPRSWLTLSLRTCCQPLAETGHVALFVAYNTLAQ